MTTGDPRAVQSHDGAEFREEDVDAELVAEELAAIEAHEPTGHQRDGGATRGLGLLLAIGGAIGLWAALALVLSDRALLVNPDASLACDINPLIGCGSFVQSWQSSVFGIPNALIGVISYTILIVTGVALFGGARLPRFYWRGLAGGVVFGAVAITWLQYQAFFELRGLCPYCLVVWAVTIPIVVQVLAAVVQAGHVSAPAAVRRLLVRERAVITAAWYLLVVVAIVVIFWNQWMLIL